LKELRLKLLEEAARLAKSLGLSEDLAYTCETCEHFFLLHIVSRWEKFLSEMYTNTKEFAYASDMSLHNNKCINLNFVSLVLLTNPKSLSRNIFHFVWIVLSHIDFMNEPND
jgi:hypothetical protein